jgi:hypothetical protein
MTRAAELPPLPKRMHTVHGWVPVVRTASKKILDDGDFGCWDAHLRIIYVRTGLHLTACWLTAFHEQCHANLDDLAPAMNYETIEVVCNAVAAARLAELLATR